MESHVLFNSFSVDLSSTVRDASTCNNKALPLNLNKRKAVEPLPPCSESKRRKQQLSHDITTETKQIDEHKSFAPAKTTQKKKQSAIPMKVSKNHRSGVHGTGEIKRNLKKRKPDDVCKSVPETSRPLKFPRSFSQDPVKVSENPKSCPVLKKNATETLELFEIAKKSADVANAKGILAAEAETSICADSLALLMEFPICSAASETKRIMARLEHLTKHKNRKICNSASALLHCWRQSIRDQELRESRQG
ncbi:PREDICTED: uncharacterized protein LOC104789120 [Camelina sativa]|uniref:Uncharacterized protein LOC104789120 n=1 Tax=Camelina sativa TaxID=90675 RepID=A0ABM0ZBB5_CAMSA|nr:PREDICTED: uncharacterized protein LOC104789120 [Camelina sativa]